MSHYFIAMILCLVTHTSGDVWGESKSRWGNADLAMAKLSSIVQQKHGKSGIQNRPAVCWVRRYQPFLCCLTRTQSRHILTIVWGKRNMLLGLLMCGVKTLAPRASDQLNAFYIFLNRWYNMSHVFNKTKMASKWSNTENTEESEVDVFSPIQLYRRIHHKSIQEFL